MTEEELEAIKAHCINPVDSRETGLEKPETLVTKFEEPADVKIFDGFKDMPEAELKELYEFSWTCYDIQGFPAYPELFQRGGTQRSIYDRDPCAGYLLV